MSAGNQDVVEASQQHQDSQSIKGTKTLDDKFPDVDHAATVSVVDEKALPITPDGGEPTEEEKQTLKHVAERLPLSAWLVAIVELSERFTYYGMSGLFQNYVQRPYDGSQGRGALGLGHRGATGLTTFFQFWCYGNSLSCQA